ncbi:glycoside hydrolase family 3 C-terminal domain-containing protein [Qipengyuania vulgaris]|nr:glycoside hydrolase family 3 N-terminal domain-containing protein [Qipengyuania vulgaris]
MPGYPSEDLMIQPATDTECQRLIADLLVYMSPLEKAGQLTMRPAPPADDQGEMERLATEVRAGRIGSISGIQNHEQADYFQNVAQTQSRLGIPLLFPAETGTGIDTIFPTAFAGSSSWDMNAIEASEAAIAQEADQRGINWAFSPEVILSNAREAPADTCGQDTHLAASIAAARIRGLQQADTRGAFTLLSCLDLSAVVASRGKEGNAVWPTRALEIALAAIRDANVGSIAIGATDGDTKREVDMAFGFLKGPGGFDGIWLSEWDELAGELTASEIAGLREGMSADLLVSAIDQGLISSERLDSMVSRVLRAKFRLGLLRAALSSSLPRQASTLPTPIHNREIALELARRSPVLLRNEPPLLPLGIDAGDILLVGPAASDRSAPLAGREGIAASIIDGFEQLGVPHRYVSGLALRGGGTAPGDMIAADRMAIGMAIEAAKRAGTVVLALAGTASGELGEANEQLMYALSAANPRLVLVTMGPRPIDPRISGRSLPCILHAGQLGTMSGHAIAELLTAESSPSGKLSMGIFSPDGAVMLPFGHGHTYADFALTDFTIELGRDRFYAIAQLHNTGTCEGTETVQLYIARRTVDDGVPSKHMPLADFQRVRLRPGERETLTIEIGREELGAHQPDGSFRIEGGTFDVFLGLSSERGIAGRITLSEQMARAMTAQGIHPSPTLGAFGTLRSA